MAEGSDSEDHQLVEEIEFEIDTFKFVTDMIIYMLRQRDIVWVPKTTMDGKVDYFGVDVARILLPLTNYYREEFRKRSEQAKEVLFTSENYFKVFICEFNASLFFKDGFRWIKFSSLLAFGSELAYFCIESNQHSFVDIVARTLAVLISATHEEVLSKNGRWAGYLDYCKIRGQDEHIRAAAIQAAEEMTAGIAAESDRAFSGAFLAAGAGIIASLAALRLTNEAQVAGTSLAVSGVAQATEVSSEAASEAQIASESSAEPAICVQVDARIPLEKTGSPQTSEISSEAAGAESVETPSADTSDEIPTIVGETAVSLQTAAKSSQSPVATKVLDEENRSKKSQSEDELKDRDGEKQTR